MEWLTEIFSFIFSFLFGEENSDGTRDGGLITNIWDGAKSIGSGVLDWFKSDDVGIGTKAAALLGGAYLIAPDTTTKVVSNAVDGVTGTVGNAAGSVATTVWGFIKKNWMLIAGGIALYLILSDED